MTDHVDHFYAALTVLAGHGHIKQRLVKAFEENLADIHDNDLPITLKQPFADLRHRMQQVTPLTGESATCASVRKMSCEEAGECAASLVAIYRDLIRLTEDSQVALPLADADEVRVPPFLIKSV